MKPKEFARLLERDGYCLHCGETVAISPQHRVNRQMGGSKLRGGSSNLIVLCSLLNGLIESDSWYRSMAIRYGWKLSSWEDPNKIPTFDGVAGVWYLLDNDFGRIVCSAPTERE
jgi:hypothetical protein